MKSLMTLTGILAFSFASFSLKASDFSCPVAANLSNYTCSGTVRVQSMAQLNAYKNDFGATGTVAKSILIDFSPSLTEDLEIATPCMVKFSPNITLTTTANICLNGKKGILIEEGLNFTGKNLNLESNESVIVNKNSIINAQNIKLLSIGTNDVNQAFIRDGAKITATSLTIESLYKGFVGRNSDVKLTGALGIYSRGDEEASIREGAKVEAAKIDVTSSQVTTIANLTTLTANEIILQGNQGCNISKGAVITGAERIGNCFLTSLTQEKFSIDKNRGNAPLVVNFNASTISETVTGYVWNFGDGQTQTTYEPTVSHTYASAGSYTATLMYATLANLKGQKSAGALQIDVKAAPVVPTTPPRGNFSYAQDGTFVYLKAFIRKTQFDIASAYYVIDDNQNNKIYLTNFYQNSQSSVEMNTFGTHKVTMYVEDVQGQKYNTTMMIDLKQNEEQISPVVRFYGEQSAPRTAFINMASSFIPYPDEFLKDFRVEFGDGQVAEVHDAVSVVHTYAAAGTYNVKVTAEFNGIERFLVVPVTVTNDNKPALSPVAAFDYHLFDFAGNVTFNDDRSATPNGEIISYVWNFGDGSQAYGKLASHFFAPGNHLVSLTVTDTMGLTSTQRQMISIPEPGDDIVSNLSCWEDGNKKLACDVFALDKFDEITRVRVQWGDGTSVNLTGQAEIEEWGLYFAEHVYQNYGTYNLRLTVDTARGQTKYAYASFAFSENSGPMSPMAGITCYSESLNVYCNGLGSFDADGYIVEYEFDYNDGSVIKSIDGFSQHTYSTGGAYLIKLKVKDSDGLVATSSFQVNLVTPVNNPPESDLYCANSYYPMITCFAVNPIDDGYIVSSTLEIDGVVYTNTNFSTPRNYMSIPGEHDIKFFVTDNNGLNSAVKELKIIVKENIAPHADAYCTIDYNKVNCSSFGSIDYDGSITTTYWDFGDGTTAQGDIANHTYLSSGQYKIRAWVADNYNLQTLVEHDYWITGSIPVAMGKCDFWRQSFDCDATGSYDLDGNIVEYRWSLNNKVVASGMKASFDVDEPGFGNVTLTIIDNFNNAQTLNVTSYTVEGDESPVADFDCIVLAGQIECDGIMSRDDGKIKEYIWQYNGQIKTGSVAVFPVQGTTHLIKLTVKDNVGNTNQKEFTFNSSEAQENNITLFNKKSMYSVDENIQLDFSNIELNDDLALNYFYVNDVKVLPENIDYDIEEKNVQLSLDLVDGENILKAVLVDSNGNEKVYEDVLEAGKRAIAVNLHNKYGNSINAETITLISAKTKKEYIFNVISNEIKDVPSEDFFVKVKAGNIFITGFIFKNENEINVHEKNLNVVSTVNYDFSNGLDSWDLSVTSNSVANNSLEFISNEREAFLRRGFKGVTGEYSAFSFDVTSSHKAYASVVFRNRINGDVEDYYYVLGDEDVLKIRNSILAKNNDDIFDVELTLYQSSYEEPETSWNKVFGTFMSSAYATGSGIKVVSKGITIQNGLGNIVLKNAKNKDFSNISLGTMPVYLDQNGQTTLYPYATSPSVNKIKFSIPIENKFERRISNIKLLIKGKNYSNEVNSTDWQLRNAKIEGVFRIGSYSKTPPSSVRLSVLITLLDGQVIQQEFSKVLYTLVSASSRSISLLNSRYGTEDGSYQGPPNRDLALGGDDWGTVSTIEFLEGLVNYSKGDYNNPAYESDKPFNIRFNDISVMNGGIFPPHLGHAVGNSIDLVFNGYYQANDINPASAEGLSKVNKTTAQKLMHILNYDYLNSKKIYRLLVNYKPNTPFTKEMEQTCLLNGYMPDEIFQNDSGHGDHFHLNVLSGLNPPGRRNIRMCSNVSSDLSTLNIKPCEFDKHPQDNEKIAKTGNISVWAKEEGSDGEYEKLSGSSGTYVIPENLRGTVLELKIIDRGDSSVKSLDPRLGNLNRSIGCGQQITLVDTRNVKKCSSSEYGEFFFDNHTGDTRYLASLFVGESTWVKSLWANVGAGTENTFSSSEICQGSTLDVFKTFRGNVSVKNSLLTGDVVLSESTIVDSEVSGAFFYGAGQLDGYAYNTAISNSYVFDSKIESAGVFYAEVIKTPIKKSSIAGRNNETKIKINASNVQKTRIENLKGYLGLTPSGPISINQSSFNCSILLLENGYFGFSSSYKYINQIDEWRSSDLNTCPME